MKYFNQDSRFGPFLIAISIDFLKEEVQREVPWDMLFVDFSSELCCGRAMVAYKKPQHRKKEESKRLRGERDQINI